MSGHLTKTVSHVSTTMVTLQRQLHAAGLHETAKAVNDASQKLGWEAAKLLERAPISSTRPEKT